VTIASQADVEAVLLRTLTANEALYIGALLARADGLILGELPYWKFDGIVNNHAADVAGVGSFEVWLPGRPVIGVDSVTVDGQALAASEYSWFPFGDLAREGVTWWGSGTGQPAIWPRGSVVHVVWDYGLAAAPSELVTLAADLVVVGLTSTSTQNVQSQRFDDYAITYATGAASAAMTRVDLDQYGRILDHYRYPVSV
jgi:hypothetical protein